MTEIMKKRIVELLLTFCMITTGSVFVCVVYNEVFWPQGVYIEKRLLWQLLATAFVCSMGNFIHSYREVSRRQMMINGGLHYLYINTVVMGCGYWFGWIDKNNFFMAAVMALGILIVFAVVFFAMLRLHVRESENLNRKLREYQEAGGRIKEKGGQ